MAIMSNLLEDVANAVTKSATKAATALAEKVCPDGQRYDDLQQRCVAPMPELTAGVNAAPQNTVSIPTPVDPVEQGIATAGTILGNTADWAAGLMQPTAGAQAEVLPPSQQMQAPEVDWLEGNQRAEGTLRGQLLEQREGQAVDLAGETAKWVMDEQGNPVSRFMANTVRPIAGEVGELAGDALGNTAPGIGANLALSPLGIDTGDVGEFAAEALTPASPIDLFFSVAFPATADWTDAKKFFDEAGLLDDAGRFVQGFSRQKLDDALRKAGKTYDELVQAVGKGLGPRAGIEGPLDNLGKQVSDEAARMADEAAQGAAAPLGRAADEVPAVTGSSASSAPADLPPSPPAGAAVATAEPPGGFAGNIRLEKYPEDVQPLLKRWADANPDAVQAARRGVRSDEQVLADAENLVNDLGGDFAKMQRQWKPGDAWNAEEVTAIRGALSDATRRVIDSAEAARAAPGSLREQSALAEAILEQQRLQEIVTGVTAEAGRTLRAFRTNAAEALADGNIKAMQDLLKRSIGTSDPEKLAELAEMVKALDVNDPIAVAKFLRNVNKPNFWDKLHFYWINSILSGPITQTRNIFGNISASLYKPVQLLGAAGVDTVTTAVRGGDRHIFWQEAPASLAGIFQGLPQGVRGALQTLQTGISPTAAAKLDIRPAPIGGKAGRLFGFPTTALGAADEFFTAINTRAALNANAVRMARSEGLRGDALSRRIAELVADPPPNLVRQATQEAEEAVFRGDPGEVAGAIANLRNKVPGGRYIIPFLTTPANLLKYGIKNSPLGLLDFNAWRKAMAGNPEGAQELANAFIGANVAAALSALVATGQIDITVAAPINAAERDRFFREGKRPFSVQIPGLGWVEYKQVPMLDTTFTLVGSAVDGIRRGEDVSGIVAQAATNIGTNLLDKSYMSGIADLFDAIDDPARYAERYALRHLSGYIPFSGASRQIAQIEDRTIRQPEGIGEQVQSQIPLLSENVPPRLTAFGEEAQRSIPSPLQISPDRQSAVDAELDRIGLEVSFVGKSVGGRELSREERAEYQRLAGQETYRALASIIGTPLYAGLSDQLKERALQKAIDKARDYARDMINFEYTRKQLEGATR